MEQTSGIDRTMQDLFHASTSAVSFVLSDARQPDCPIVYASQNFFELTGYSPNQVLGHNCRFLQGPATSKRKVAEIRDAIREDRACNVCLLNYRRDGSTFWNQFYLAPIRDEQGVAMYVGIQCDVSAAVKTACATADDPEALLESFHCGDQPTTDAVERALSTCRVEHLLANVAGQGVGEHGSTGACSCHHGRAADKGAGGAAASLVRPDRHRSTTSISSTGSADSISAAEIPTSLRNPLMRIQSSFVLSDPNLADCPIVHASSTFLEMTGYPRDQVIGRNCRFLQGPLTDPTHIAKIRAALAADPPEAVTVTLVNYKLDGTAFYNGLHVAPVRDAHGKVRFFAGVQMDLGRLADQPPGLQTTTATQTTTTPHDAPEPLDLLRPRDKLKQKSCVAAVRVAVRSLADEGLRRSHECQHLPE